MYVNACRPGGRIVGPLFAGYLALTCAPLISGCADRDRAATHEPAAGTDDSPPGPVGHSPIQDPPRIQPTAAAPAPRRQAADPARAGLYDPGDQTDNSACLVCHIDLQDEQIAADHLEAGIVCAACHGPSEPHRSDELNVITPDVTFGRSEIEVFCKACHPVHKMSEGYDAFVKQWYGKRRPNGRMVLDNSVCTDCHGNHAVLRPEQQIPG